MKEQVPSEARSVEHSSERKEDIRLAIIYVVSLIPGVVMSHIVLRREGCTGFWVWCFTSSQCPHGATLLERIVMMGLSYATALVIFVNGWQAIESYRGHY